MIDYHKVVILRRGLTKIVIGTSYRYFKIHSITRIRQHYNITFIMLPGSLKRTIWILLETIQPILSPNCRHDDD